MAAQVRVQATTLRQEVFRVIRQEILSGQFLPGTKLVETDLAARYGVSRNPVREAINRLEEQGLVTSIPNQGTYIVKLTPEQLQNAFLVRVHLELLAVRLIFAKSHPAPEKFNPLAEIVDEMQAVATGAAKYNSPEHNAEAHGRMNLLDADFHQELIGCSGNDALERTWATVAPVDLVFAYDIAVILDGTKGQPELKNIADQHARLLAHLRNGDKRAAEAEFKAHFTSPYRAHSTYLDETSLSVLGYHE